MKITHIDVYSFTYTLAGGPLTLSGGRTVGTEDTTLVKISTDEGLVGWGEECPFSPTYMFYGDYGLHGKTDRGAQRGFLMLGEDERYDLAHFEFVLRGAAAVRERHPRLADHVSVSLHCEIADILNAYTRIVQQDPSLTGLRAYSAARPPHSEGLGVWIASYLAHEAACRNVNLLHLSSRKALEAALLMR